MACFLPSPLPVNLALQVSSHLPLPCTPHPPSLAGCPHCPHQGCHSSFVIQVHMPLSVILNSKHSKNQTFKSKLDINPFGRKSGLP